MIRSNLKAGYINFATDMVSDTISAAVDKYIYFKNSEHQTKKKAFYTTIANGQGGKEIYFIGLSSKIQPSYTRSRIVKIH